MLETSAAKNAGELKENAYPGRGIVLGATPDDKKLVQIYWIMGRSENSRNRIFLKEGEFVRTKAYDESKVKDPSLIIYFPVKVDGTRHIVSNGDQTDTVYAFLKAGKSMEEALHTREFEPDAPNFTPRITGFMDLGSPVAYTLSILKTHNGNPAYPVRHFYNYEKAIPGTGHLIHTYASDGDPLPSFSGEPKIMPVYSGIKENLDFYWSLLNVENRVSLMVKTIDRQTGKTDIEIINKHEVK